MTTIYLVRHGITQANKENRFAGRTTEGLHPDGAEQIRQVGKRLQGKEIGRIFCGPLPRTVQSAEILSLIFPTGMV
jgi:broad specificity phosphatase PhoE